MDVKYEYEACAKRELILFFFLSCSGAEVAKIESLSTGVNGPVTLIQQTAAGQRNRRETRFSPNELEYINACVAMMPSPHNLLILSCPNLLAIQYTFNHAEVLKG